jgi:LPS export ABC transporter protein LptC
MSRSEQWLDRLIAWSPVLLLGSLAAQVQPTPLRDDASRRHASDIFIDNFRADSFDAAGRLRQSIGARRAKHYADDETVDFEAPSLALTEPGEPHVTVTADHGTLSGDREIVELRGNVHATRGAGPSKSGENAPSGPITVVADSLRVLPQQGKASTQGPVTIEEPRGIIRAVGMDLDDRAHTLKLRSAVRGTLQPQAAPKLPSK